MPYTSITQRPEVPIDEDLVWQTDVIVSDDGTEQSINLAEYPRRVFSGTHAFDTAAQARRHLASMIGLFAGLFFAPQYQYAVPLKSPASAGGNSLTVNALRGDLRAGRSALLTDGATFEEVTINTVAANTVTIVGVLANSYKAGATLAPMTQCYTANNSGFTRRNPDDTASASFVYNEYAPQIPFLHPLNVATVDTFDGLPLLDKNALGDSFEQQLDTGKTVNQGVGLPDIRSRWTDSDWLFSLTFKAERVFDLDDWFKWLAFFDEIKGSWKPFLLPTWRSDLDIETPAAGGGSSIELANDEFSGQYEGHESFSRVVVTSDAGRHFASVVNVATASGKDTLTIDPPLPAGAGWETNQTLGFLLKVRLTNDTVSLKHMPLHTMIDLALRTVE